MQVLLKLTWIPFWITRRMTIEFLYAKIRNGSEFEILEHAGFWSYHIMKWRSSFSDTLPQAHSCALALFTVTPLHRPPCFLFLNIVETKIFFSSVLFQNMLGKADFSVVCFDLVPLYFFSFSHSYRLVLSVWSFVFILILLFGGERASHLPSVSVSWLLPWAVYWGILLLLSSWDFTTLSSANSSEHVILPLNIAFGTKNSPEI